MKNLYKLSFVHIAILVFSLLTYSQSFSECNYSGCAPIVQTPTENYINRVKCGNIDKTSYTQSTVANYTSLSTDMTVGLSYSIIVYNGNAWGTDQVSVFIDWNKDCDFNDTGETYVLNSNQGGWNFTGFISVPMSAVVGSTRMRIRMSLNSTPAPCDFSLYGEVEDYSINVITAPSINTTQLVDSQFCVGSSFQVSYEIAGTFNLGNQFTAQLSDEFGNFNNPTTIGTLNSTGNGTIECTLLDTAKASNNYYIRIVSSDPVIIGTIQGPISISSLPIAYKILGDGIYCSNNLQGALIELDSSQVNTHYQLKIDTTNVGSVVVGTGSKISFGYFTAEGSYTIEATSPDGCKNIMENIVQVKKVQPPTVFSMSSGNRIFNQLVDTSFCDGDIGIAIGLSGSENNVHYILKVNGNKQISSKIGTGTDLSFGIFTEEGTYTIEAITVLGLCTNIMKGSIKIRKILTPKQYTILGADHFCEGSEGSEIGLSKSDNGVIYQLMRDGRPIGNPISGTGSSISFGKQNIVGLYTIEAASIEGNCTKEMNGNINLKEIPSPEISITGNMTPKFGGNENYTDESAGEDDQYVWTVLGGKIQGSNTSSSVIIDWGNNKTGKVRLTKTNVYGCTTTVEVDINLINNVVADFEVDKIKGEVPFEVKFTDKSEGYITYHNWDFGDGYSSPLLNPSHVYKIPGKYTVKLTVGYDDVFIDKIKTDLITAENVLGVNESSANLISKNGISISAIEPNPSSDVIRFTYGVNTPQNISIAIYNIYGERVMAISDGYISEGTYNKEMDISNLPSGAYYLQILGKDGQVNQMISVVR